MGKVFTISITALLILSSQLALFGLDKPKVLLIVNEGPTADADKEFMLTKEVGIMMSILKEAGFQVVVATESGSTIISETVNLEPDLTVDEVLIDEYEGIIMPCMAIPVEEPEPPKLVELVKQAASKGIPIAAQYNSVFILAEAKILLGKRYAIYHDYGAQGDSRFDGAQYMGRGVVQDGNIITSGICPFMAKTSGLTDGTPELTKLLIQLISKK